MKNTVLDFDTEEVDLDTDTFGDVNICNYFSKDVKIYNILTDDLDDIDIDDYTLTYKMSDDDRLERISYDLYGTTDYWDVLARLNERDPLLHIPYNYDVISEDNTSFVDAYFNSIYSQAPLTDDTRIDALTSEFATEEVSLNEEYRYITVIKPSKMSSFLTLLTDQGYL